MGDGDNEYATVSSFKELIPEEGKWLRKETITRHEAHGIIGIWTRFNGGIGLRASEGLDGSQEWLSSGDKKPRTGFVPI